MIPAIEIKGALIQSAAVAYRLQAEKFLLRRKNSLVVPARDQIAMPIYSANVIPTIM
jgi:hypothetical protein